MDIYAKSIRLESGAGAGASSQASATCCMSRRKHLTLSS